MSKGRLHGGLDQQAQTRFKMKTTNATSIQPRRKVVTARHAIATLVMAGIALFTLPNEAYGWPLFEGSGPRTSPQMVSGDFNNDGYMDVAKAFHDASVDDLGSAGMVAIWYGTPTGLDSNPIAISQNSPGVPGDAEASDHFGWALATGDFNGDGFSDLGVGAPFKDPGGAVHP